MRIVDRHNPQKLYLQLAEIIQEGVDRAELMPGQQLPTEDMFCTRQGVSKAVVRAAMQELAKKGYVVKIPSKGTFVKKPAEAGGIWLSTLLTENILDFGIKWETEVIQKMLTAPPSDLTELFSMESGRQVFKVMRVRHINEAPVALDTAYVSHDLCPGLPLEDLRSSSLLEVLTKKYSIPITRCADSLEITTLEEKEASLLNKAKGESALLTDRILYTTNNRVAAFVRVISVSQQHRITFEAVRTP